MAAPVSPPPAAPPGWLPTVLEQILRTEHPPPDPDPEPAPCVLLRFEVDGDGFSLGSKALRAGEHPVDALLGFVAPDEWFAFGVLAHGWATHLVDDGDSFDEARNRARRRPSRQPDRVRVRTIHAVARDGTEAGALHLAGDQPSVRGPFRATDPGALTGATPDVVRRVMGVATAPAAFAPQELLAAVWLTAVAAAPRPDRRRLRWSEAVAVAPGCVQALELGERHPTRLTWSSVRWAAVEGAALGVDPTLAAWFDDGSFARWAISEFLPVPDLVGLVQRAVTAPAHRAVLEHLRRWRVPT